MSIGKSKCLALEKIIVTVPKKICLLNLMFLSDVISAMIVNVPVIASR